MRPGDNLKELVALVKRRMRRVWSACILEDRDGVGGGGCKFYKLTARCGENFPGQSGIDILCAVRMIF